jgi:hypothetical protein
MPEPSGTAREPSGPGAARRRAPRGGVFSAPEHERLVAAFRTGNGAATEAELAAFVAWARGVRLEGGLLTLILQGVALPIRPDGVEGYRFRVATDAEQSACAGGLAPAPGVPALP